MNGMGGSIDFAFEWIIDRPYLNYLPSLSRIAFFIVSIFSGVFGHGVKSMNIELKSEQEQFIRSQIESGEYQTADDVISEAFKLLAARSIDRANFLLALILFLTFVCAESIFLDRVWQSLLILLKERYG